ncbi:MAG: YciI family protein [Alphaproteobacteria bacterium]|nr:YciI family protein [Alphaproteobacteria bacterium]
MIIEYKLSPATSAEAEKQDNIFLVILSYKVPLEKIDAFRSAHLEFLSNYYAKDTFIVSGPQSPRKGGIIIAKSADKDTLQQILHQDPFAAKDFATYEIIEFSPTKWSKGFESIIFAHGKEDDLNKILAELKSREPIFHHPEKFGKTKEDIANQMCDEFWEVGASGNVYTKQDVIETLLERYNNPDFQDIWETNHFAITKIAPDHYLTTYILIQDKTRVTRRSTLWRKKNGDWKILYHQGTVIDKGSIII